MAKSEKLFVVVEWDDGADLSESPEIAGAACTSEQLALASANVAAQEYGRSSKCKFDVKVDRDDLRVSCNILGQAHRFKVREVKLPAGYALVKTGAAGKPKKKERVTVISRGIGKYYASAEAAIKFYTEAVNGCDPQSSECARYNEIINMLRSGFKVVDADHV